MGEGDREKRYVWLTTRVEPGFAEQVAELARRQERKKSELVRWLLKQALARELADVSVPPPENAYLSKEL